MRLRFTLLFMIAVTAVAQISKTVADNEYVRALKVEVQPHAKTRLHEHTMNRVMIYLQPGRQDLLYKDGRKVLLQWKAGEAKWSPASGLHVAEITSNNPVTIIEIELKKQSPGTRSTSDLDAVRVDPKHYRVEFENSQVRVLRVRIGPHEIAPLHEHSLNRVVTYLTSQKVRVTADDGQVSISQRKAGEVSWAGPAKHREENLSDDAFEVAVVEVK
jgi:quercetin dioxygenase-like cupin family protein